MGTENKVVDAGYTDTVIWAQGLGGLACWFVCFNAIAALASQNQTAAFRTKSAQRGITFESLGEI